MHDIRISKPPNRHRRSRGRLRLLASAVAIAATTLGVGTGVAQATTTVYSLPGGGTMVAGDVLKSPNGCFQAEMQTDGNFVLYQAQGHVPYWASNTDGHAGAWIAMQGDGNLVLYTQTGAVLYGNKIPSNTDGHPGSDLEMQNDGNLVIYKPGHTPIWATGTSGRGCSTPPPASSCPASGSMDARFFEQTAHANTDLRLQVRWVQNGACSTRTYIAGSGVGQSACSYHNWIPADTFQVREWDPTGYGANLSDRAAFALRALTKSECGSSNARYASGNFAIHSTAGLKLRSGTWTATTSTNTYSYGCIKLSTNNFKNLYDVYRAAGSPAFTVTVVRNQGLPANSVSINAR